MKRIICLMLTIFILTGCTAQYNLNINDSLFEETAYLVQDSSIDWNTINSIYWNSTVNDVIGNEYDGYTGAEINSNEDIYSRQKVEGVKYYNKTRLLTNKENGIKYDFKFDTSNYNLSKIANYCYDDFNVKISGNEYSISTSDQFNCFDYYNFLDDVEVNIILGYDYDVLSNNADKVEKNVYTWIINKNNANNKPVEITVKKVYRSPITPTMALIGLGITLVVLCLGFLIFRKLSMRNNEI